MERVAEQAEGVATGQRAADAVRVAAKDATVSVRAIVRPFLGEGVMLVDRWRFFRVMVVDRMAFVVVRACGVVRAVLEGERACHTSCHDISPTSS